MLVRVPATFTGLAALLDQLTGGAFTLSSQ
jgi:hypothetical protein